MPNASKWVLIFSDGTGQRGVRDDGAGGNTNIYLMYQAVQKDMAVRSFYDPGLGAPAEGALAWTRTFRNLWSKATGWGITANIVDCYEALITLWEPGMKVGLFGFSRGAYTVRCVGGVLGAVGIATSVAGTPIPPGDDPKLAKLRRKIAQEAVDIYKLDPDTEKAERQKRAAKFRADYDAANEVASAVGVFDTVKALGLPGVIDVVNPIRHVFHDNYLSERVPVGLHALSIDENRKTFKAEPWNDRDVAGQTLLQCWFPGVHSDIGGGYEDDRRLADVSLAWMLDSLRQHADLDIPVRIDSDGTILGTQHDERTGMGRFWLPGKRAIRDRSRDIDFLCAGIESRFDGGKPRYRPVPLRTHPRVSSYYP